VTVQSPGNGVVLSWNLSEDLPGRVEDGLPPTRRPTHEVADHQPTAEREKRQVRENPRGDHEEPEPDRDEPNLRRVYSFPFPTTDRSAATMSEAPSRLPVLPQGGHASGQIGRRLDEQLDGGGSARLSSIEGGRDLGSSGGCEATRVDAL